MDILHCKTDFHAARYFLVFLPRVPISVEFMIKCGTTYHLYVATQDLLS